MEAATAQLLCCMQIAPRISGAWANRYCSGLHHTAPHLAILQIHTICCTFVINTWHDVSEFVSRLCSTPFPVASRSKAWVCDPSLAGIAGSNHPGGMDVCLVWVLCVISYGPLWQADDSSRGVLLSVYLWVWSGATVLIIFITVGLSPGGSGYLTCTQNMKLVCY
jgi:hypothetical protein